MQECARGKEQSTAIQRKDLGNFARVNGRFLGAFKADWPAHIIHSLGIVLDAGRGRNAIKKTLGSL